MSCDYQLDKIYITVVKVSRTNKTAFIFIGDSDKSNKKLMEKKKEVINKFGEINVHFINDLIEINDSVSNIRKKIFYYLSDPSKKQYILPENQELWVKNRENKDEIIGFYYQDLNQEKIDLKPSVNENPKKDERFKSKLNFKINNSENNILIYDLIKFIGIKEDIIYVTDAVEEYNYLKNKIKINKNIENTYFKKHFPYYTLNLDKAKNQYILLEKKYKEDKQFQKLEKKYNKGQLLGDCFVTYVSFRVNHDMNNNSIDLYQVFDYIREKKISTDIPFIKYGDESFTIPVSLVSIDALSKNIFKRSTLNEWIGIQHITDKINGIIIQKYIMDYQKEAKFMSIILRNNAELSFRIRFQEQDKATFHDVVHGVKDVKKLIEDVNKNIMSKKVNINYRIDPPDIHIDKNKKNMRLSENTEIRFCSIFIPIQKKINIDYKKLYDFSSKFKEYLHYEIKNDKDKSRSLRLIYKKVSGFIPMSDILLRIDRLKSEGIGNHNIIQILSHEFDQTQDEIQRYLIEWEKKYASYMSKRIDSEMKVGVEIEITSNYIKLKNISKLYQVPLIYNFLNTFLSMFLYEKNNNLEIKPINNNEDSYIEVYPNHNNNDNNFNFDYDALDLDSENKYERELINERENDNQDPNNEKGIASIQDISPEIRLKCNDAIENEGRCGDACNDSSYALRRLQKYDNFLFNFKGNPYSRMCGTSQQPIIVPYNPLEKSNIQRNSFTYTFQYSSKPEEFKRWYICPWAWCPTCEIPIANDQIDEQTINKRQKRNEGAACITAKCPNGNHQVIIRDNQYLYPGFISGKHPNGLCLPCCFKIPQNLERYKKKYVMFKKCLGEEAENENEKKGMLYILRKESPIEKNRFGKLPEEVSRVLDTQLESGYLGENSGYLKKGIEHKKNQSFLSALIDIMNCNIKNMDEKKLKKTLVEKLTMDLFLSLFNGNLDLRFHDEKKNISSMDNYKNYIQNDNIIINHENLWDYIQRPGILFEEGINLIIFYKNTVLCPFGDDINDYYDKDKKTIIMLKTRNLSKDYYEPIYYLEGDGKKPKETCIFISNKIEIMKIFEILNKGCQNSYNIDWEDVLKKNIKQRDLKIDTMTYRFEYGLRFTMKELIESKKIHKKKFFPKMQLIDSHNKVFGVLLDNDYYIPTKPSKLIDGFPFKQIINKNDLPLMDYKKYIELTKYLSDNTDIKFSIEHKILDNKNKKYIIALLNNNQRIIPVKKSSNNDKLLKIANTKYFSDINEYLHNQIIMNDNRIDKIHKKNFEDETFQRMRFELSLYLQRNKKDKQKILDIIHGDNQYNNKSLEKSRKEMYLVLNKIFSELCSQKEKKIDFFTYKTPNKRIPCGNYSVKNKNNFYCESDPHCVIDKNACKLYIHKINLIELHKNIKNYPYYLARLLDELLRFKIKREELLNNEIENILHKNYVPENEKKYLILQTYNIKEIDNKLEKLFFNNQGINMDLNRLYDESTTKKFAFNKNLFLKEKYNNNENVNNLSTHWERIMGSSFKVKKQPLHVFEIFKKVLNKSDHKNNNIYSIKEKLIRYWIDQVKDNRNKNKKQNTIFTSYKDSCGRLLKNIENYDDLIDHIKKSEFKGCMIDLITLSKIYDMNIIIIDKRIKNNKGINFIRSKSINYIILYRTFIEKQPIYQIVRKEKKIVFTLNDFSPKFIQDTLQIQ